MRFSVLSSGSRANCTFVEVGSRKILIDCGLSATQAEYRLGEINVNPCDIDAILITHEHSDHISGVSVLSRRFKIPVYANSGTSQFLKAVHGMEIFTTGVSFCLGEVKISSFSIVHDAVEPVGFVIRGGGFKFAQVTDLGRVTPLVRDALADSNAIVLESNHDYEMLQYCSYPWHLKQRISSSHGHLSNSSAGEFLADLVHPGLLHIVLGHLSEQSNTPEVAISTVKQFLPGTMASTIRCASAACPTPLLPLDSDQVVGF